MFLLSPRPASKTNVTKLLAPCLPHKEVYEMFAIKAPRIRNARCASSYLKCEERKVVLWSVRRSPLRLSAVNRRHPG